jgi:acyl dehydratase
MFEIGQTFRLTTAITAEDARHAVLVSQDTQPVHMNAEYAARTHFGRTIAPGVLAIGRVAGLLGTRLVDPRTHYIVTEQFAVRFVRPLFAGDDLAMRAIVTGWDAKRRRVTVKLEARNQDERRVLAGTASLVVFAVDTDQAGEAPVTRTGPPERDAPG